MKLHPVATRYNVQVAHNRKEKLAYFMFNAVGSKRGITKANADR